MWLFAILVVLALGGIAVVASGRGAPMSPAYDDAPDSLVPAEGPVTADDLRRIRFPLAFRGYRMAEVDALLERLAEEREEADRRRTADTDPAPTATPTTTPAATPTATPAAALEPGDTERPERTGDTERSD